MHFLTDIAASLRNVMHMWSVLYICISRNTAILLATALLTCCEASKPLHAKPIGKTIALLIGVSEYSDSQITNLPYVGNDVDLLAKALTEYSGLRPELVVRLSDTTPPTRRNILKFLGEVVEKVQPGDHLLVYFSGHATRDGGDLYLIPSDANLANVKDTCVATFLVRQELKKSRASLKTLLLDSCFAGTTKGSPETAAVGAEALAKSLTDVNSQHGGVLTIASCKADQNSHLWIEKRQSIFSYWLARALHGHADKNQNGIIDSDELYNFVHDHVEHSSRRIFGPGRLQTPMRIADDVSGNPDLITLTPQDLKQVDLDIAEQVAWDLEEQSRQRAIVIGFTTYLNGMDESTVNGQMGQLSKSCTVDIRQQLTEHLKGRLPVIVDREETDLALKSTEFAAPDVNNADKLSQLCQQTGADVAIVGNFTERSGSEISLQLLAKGPTGEIYSTASGLALASTDTMAEMGRSVDFRRVHSDLESGIVIAAPQVLKSNPAGMKSLRFQPAALAALFTSDSKTLEDRVVAQAVDSLATEPHPLRNKNFDFPVWLEVNGQRIEPRFCPGLGTPSDEIPVDDCYVAVPRGDDFVIGLENRSNDTVILRLLVDGFNTVPQGDEGQFPAIVHLNEAKPWVLAPSRQYAVRGFVTRLAGDADHASDLRTFRVVDASQSLGARQKFTEQLGLVTAAFYEAQPSTRGVGVTLGDEKKEVIQQVTGWLPGRMLAVVHLRYHDSSETPPCK